jgi:LacI family transcriptional regulator, galactose operon repressor
LTRADAANPPERTGFIGVLIPYLRGGYFPEIFEGIAEAVHERGLRLVLSPTQHEHAREVSLLDRLMQGATRGAVVVLPEETTEELEHALNDRYPFVVVDPLLPLGDRIPTVSVAHRSGAEQAMRHLLTLGHRRIAAITGPRGWLATEGRRAAYHTTLAAAGIQPEPAYEVASDFQVGPAVQAAATLLDLPEPPTAIFAFNDSIAFGALRAARDRGLRVPEDLSVVGFDDIEPATLVTPALTTVRQPLSEIGRTAVNVLVRLIERRASETPHIELATRLVVRESTAPPPRSAAG